MTAAFPHEQVRWLADVDFGTVRIPSNHGGFGASLQQTFAAVGRSGRGGPERRAHLAQPPRVRRGPAQRTASDTNDTWIKRFLAGEFVGGGWTEANNVTLANIASTITAEDDHWAVTGAKYYATGSLYADWLDVLGRG